jgi:hypothetical protein
MAVVHAGARAVNAKLARGRRACMTDRGELDGTRKRKASCPEYAEAGVS